MKHEEVKGYEWVEHNDICDACVLDPHGCDSPCGEDNGYYKKIEDGIESKEELYICDYSNKCNQSSRLCDMKRSHSYNELGRIHGSINCHVVNRIVNIVPIEEFKEDKPEPKDEHDETCEACAYWDAEGGTSLVGCGQYDFGGFVPRDKPEPKTKGDGVFWFGELDENINPDSVFLAGNRIKPRMGIGIEKISDVKVVDGDRIRVFIRPDGSTEYHIDPEPKQETVEDVMKRMPKTKDYDMNNLKECQECSILLGMWQKDLKAAKERQGE